MQQQVIDYVDILFENMSVVSKMFKDRLCLVLFGFDTSES